MDKPIRVLHVFGRLDSGGAESRTMDIYRHIDKRKIQFDFAIHTEEECFYTKEILNLGGKIYSFPRFNGKNLYNYKNSWTNFFENTSKHLIIHGHQTTTGFIYLAEAKKYNVPIRIAHSRNSNKENFIKMQLSKLSRFYATDLFAVSYEAGISEFGKKTMSKGIVNVVSNAIEASKYTFDLNKREIKRYELNLQNKFVICNIGRFHKQKNHKYILHVFKHIYQKNSNARLLLIGDGPLRNEIEGLIKKLDLTEVVILTGVRRDVSDLLQAADVFIFPSLFEGLPGVILEAQASGLPCVISDTITKEVKITDLVEYLSVHKKPDYWANKILQISEGFIRRNTKEEIIESGFDIETVSKWYEEFYLSKYNNLK